jgi:hypothetical protein
MSRLKINYQNEVFVIVVDEEEQQRVANMFNFNVGSLPMKYLGIMISDKHLFSSDLAYIHQKVEKKLPTCQSATLSAGGKMVLIESWLSSIPN